MGDCNIFWDKVYCLLVFFLKILTTNLSTRFKIFSCIITSKCVFLKICRNYLLWSTFTNLISLWREWLYLDIRYYRFLALDVLGSHTLKLWLTELGDIRELVFGPTFLQVLVGFFIFGNPIFNLSGDFCVLFWGYFSNFLRDFFGSYRSRFNWIEVLTPFFFLRLPSTQAWRLLRWFSKLTLLRIIFLLLWIIWGDSPCFSITKVSLILR